MPPRRLCTEPTRAKSWQDFLWTTYVQAVRRKGPPVLLGACRFQAGQSFGELASRSGPARSTSNVASSAGLAARRGKVNIREPREKKQTAKHTWPWSNTRPVSKAAGVTLARRPPEQSMLHASRPTTRTAPRHGPYPPKTAMVTGRPVSRTWCYPFASCRLAGQQRGRRLVAKVARGQGLHDKANPQRHTITLAFAIPCCRTASPKELAPHCCWGGWWHDFVGLVFGTRCLKVQCHRARGHVGRTLVGPRRV